MRQKPDTRMTHDMLEKRCSDAMKGVKATLLSHMNLYNLDAENCKGQ